jgi:CubicO group peptidase (beta-lactamase class C family)
MMTNILDKDLIMRTIFLNSIFLILVINISFAQTEKNSYDTVKQNLIKSYNKDDYNAIFLMFDDQLKKSLTLEKTNQFLKGLKLQAGNIKNTEFLKYNQDTYACYKTTFERAVLSLNISLNEGSKIDGLFVKPYEQEVAEDIVINNISFTNGSITKQQVDIMFEKSKDFPKNTQIAIAIITSGKVNYYGLIKGSDTLSALENQKSVFEIGSLSKVFTSTLLASLVVEEKINLNDYVNDHIKVAFNNGLKISFIELANHSSGIPRLPTNLIITNADNPYKNYGEKELKKYLKKELKLLNRGEYQYSNTGAGLLGYILGKIEKGSYESALQEKIFSKYNMNHSTTDLNKINGNLVSGLGPEGKEAMNWEFSVLAGAGGILSTVEDLSRFAMCQFDNSNKVLSLTREKTLELNPQMDVGLGWHILNSASKNLWYWHNGATGGYSSSMTIDPESKNGVIILSNVSAFNPNMNNIDILGMELMKTLEEE